MKALGMKLYIFGCTVHSLVTIPTSRAHVIIVNRSLASAAVVRTGDSAGIGSGGMGEGGSIGAAGLLGGGAGGAC
jgi:hypothetical protein